MEKKDLFMADEELIREMIQAQLEDSGWLSSEEPKKRKVQLGIPT